MWRIRFCKDGDQDQLLELAKRAGSGMTSMPVTRSGWNEKISDTQATIKGNQYLGSYFLVLEDAVSHQIVGTTAVYAGVGEYRPYHAYLCDYSRLKFTDAFQGALEIGSLFIDPEHREPGLGSALAKSRYVLMNSFPGIFHGVVMAVCRGWLDSEDQSPFWTQIARDSAGVEFDTAVRLVSDIGNGWLSDAIPHEVPITDKIEPYIGKVHKNSEAAQAMLLRENFRKTDFVDVLDAGPMYANRVADIASYRLINSARVEVGEVASPSTVLVGGGSLENYELCIVKAEVRGGTLIVDQSTAQYMPWIERHIAKYIVL